MSRVRLTPGRSSFFTGIWTFQQHTVDAAFQKWFKQEVALDRLHEGQVCGSHCSRNRRCHRRKSSRLQGLKYVVLWNRIISRVFGTSHWNAKKDLHPKRNGCEQQLDLFVSCHLICYLTFAKGTTMKIPSIPWLLSSPSLTQSPSSQFPWHPNLVQVQPLPTTLYRLFHPHFEL
jgi:hypothetical protein